MKLDTNHYIEHDNGLVTDKDGRTYMVPVQGCPHLVRLYAGGGLAFATVDATDLEQISVEFCRRGIQPPYIY